MDGQDAAQHNTHHGLPAAAHDHSTAAGAKQTRNLFWRIERVAGQRCAMHYAMMLDRADQQHVAQLSATCKRDEDFAAAIDRLGWVADAADFADVAGARGRQTCTAQLTGTGSVYDTAHWRAGDRLDLEGSWSGSGELAPTELDSTPGQSNNGGCFSEGATSRCGSGGDGKARTRLVAVTGESPPSAAHAHNVPLAACN